MKSTKRFLPLALSIALVPVVAGLWALAMASAQSKAALRVGCRCGWHGGQPPAGIQQRVEILKVLHR